MVVITDIVIIKSSVLQHHGYDDNRILSVICVHILVSVLTSLILVLTLVSVLISLTLVLTLVLLPVLILNPVILLVLKGILVD